MAFRVGDTKVCPSCRKEFIKDKETSAYCKPCRNRYQREWAQRRPSKVRNWSLKKYGITEDEYQKLLEKQQGLCAICGREGQKHERYGLSVDHSHKHGFHRGLLCDSCNIALGHFGDDVELLEKAIAYLKEWEI